MGSTQTEPVLMSIDASALERASCDPAGDGGASVRIARNGAANPLPLADPRLAGLLARGAGHEFRAARPPGRMWGVQRLGTLAGGRLRADLVEDALRAR